MCVCVCVGPGGGGGGGGGGGEGFVFSWGYIGRAVRGSSINTWVPTIDI